MSDSEKTPVVPVAPRGGGSAGGFRPRPPAVEQPPIEEILTPRDRRHLEHRQERQERRAARRRAKGR